MSCNLGQQTKKTARVRNLISACLMAVTFSTASVFAKDGRPGLQVIAEVKHDTSLSLRDMESSVASQATAVPRRVMPLLLPHPATGEASVQADTALQKVDLPFVSASLGLNFDGLGQGQNGFVVNAAPPDTNGVVGATQYVQWVNSSFAVFDKATGARLMGPTAGNAFWAGFGGGCQSNNDGDPVIQYDKMANRWVATQFSVSTTPFLQCVAVSTTNDATGSYNRYAFTLPNFNDYPKLGIWPDGYYFSFNMFNAAGTIFFGADACAANRTAMLAGNAATMICFQQSSNVASLLPSDTDGTIKPASGEPAFFMNFGTNSLNLWKFHVDFTTPANSTFTGPTTLAVASFTPLCNGGSNCVVQPGTTQKLDSLADRLMYRLAWRKFADGHESIVINHAISTGIRWYEIQNPNGSPTVFQQGTFHPTADTRWMGSIAMDQAGDIALGYSESSGNVRPSVFFTGREPSDPAGALQSEATIVNGTGSQTGGLSRWGDYSAMTVDPVDDCTFWYTQEYMRTTGNFNWNTRIANFKFPGCGGTPTPDYTIGASPSSLTITQGGNGTSTITVTSLNGFNAATSLSASGLPSGVTAAFSPNPVTPPANGSVTSTLTLTASGTATTGTTNVTVTGTSGSLSHSTTIYLTVNSSGGGGLQTAAFDATLKAPKCANVGSGCDSGPSL